MVTRFGEVERVVGEEESIRGRLVGDECLLVVERCLLEIFDLV